jgi:hypothetical protein
MNDEDAVKRGRNAATIINDPLWAESWDIYHKRLHELIDKADSSQVEVIMQAKRLLHAGKAAKSHIESIFMDGKIAAETVRLDEERTKRMAGKAK